MLRLELARSLRQSHIQYRRASVYDLQPDALDGTFDLVVCLGVYHQRHLFLALDNLRQITSGEIRLETHVIDDHFITADGAVHRLEDIDPPS